jgi:hypothetical protein
VSAPLDDLRALLDAWEDRVLPDGRHCQRRWAATTLEELPPAKWCPQCAALRPRDAFYIVNMRRDDGTRYMLLRPRCAEHDEGFRGSRRQPGEPPDAYGYRLSEEAAERTRRAERQAAAVRRWVAEQWGKPERWMLSPGRDPDAVEMRALMAVILRSEHAVSVTAIGRAIGRDHSTVSHLLRRFSARPETRELLMDYRQWRAQRKAASTAASARKAG